MRGTPLLCSAVVVVAITLVGRTCGARKPANSVLLSNIQTLTLRKDARTSHRRVSAIPQLNCIGGSAKRIYEVDVMRCKNQGSDYNEAKYIYLSISLFYAFSGYRRQLSGPGGTSDIWADTAAPRRTASSGPAPLRCLPSLSSVQRTSCAKATTRPRTHIFSKAAVASSIA